MFFLIVFQMITVGVRIERMKFIDCRLVERRGFDRDAELHLREMFWKGCLFYGSGGGAFSAGFSGVVIKNVMLFATKLLVFEGVFHQFYRSKP
jgi:hypothetical protein